MSKILFDATHLQDQHTFYAYLCSTIDTKSQYVKFGITKNFKERLSRACRKGPNQIAKEIKILFKISSFQSLIGYDTQCAKWLADTKKIFPIQGNEWFSPEVVPHLREYKQILLNT